MKETTNFGLKKPEANDFYDFETQNENLDEIDRVLQEYKDGTQQVGDSDKLGGKEASEYLTTKSTVPASSVTSGTFNGDVAVPASSAFSTPHVANIVLVDTKPIVGADAPYPVGTYVRVKK